MHSVCLRLGAAEFTQKLTDVVKNVGETVSMTFSTKYTAPDMMHIFPNGSNVTLLSAGKVTRMHRKFGYTTTSKERLDGGYDVAIIISNVTKQDAGTYIAADDNGLLDSMRSYAELVVTGTYTLTYLLCYESHFYKLHGLLVKLVFQ